jgi:hypothetical protein
MPVLRHGRFPPFLARVAAIGTVIGILSGCSSSPNSTSTAASVTTPFAAVLSLVSTTTAPSAAAVVDDGVSAVVTQEPAQADRLLPAHFARPHRGLPEQGVALRLDDLPVLEARPIQVGNGPMPHLCRAGMEHPARRMGAMIGIRNLRVNPTARVEIGAHNQWVRAEQLPDEEAVAFWPAILQRAPTYSRYLKATSRTIPLVRLVPITLGNETSP